MAFQPPNNLPLSLSSFIGREREIAQIKQLFTEHRLVTLTGSGGCGKTRLAAQTAGELLDRFADGVWFTELASLVDAALVTQATASACEVREQPGIPLPDTLVEYFLRRHTLLVLDNCEHLITACAQLAEKLLHACPYLHILATSREPLNVPGEVLWPVPALSLPAPQPWRSPTSGQNALPDYQQAEAVRLFTERAAAISPDFVLTAENGAWVAEICRRLDGVPLAIELAAARVRLLSVQQIAARLDDRFHLLTSGRRTAPPRQQTLMATLDWSYTLLTEREKQVLQRLSVFAGGCALEAAEVVCAGSGVEQAEVLDSLSNLVDKSLVSVDSLDEQTRYRLLETIRQYAGVKLREGSGANAVEDRHLDFFMRWAETAESHLTTQLQPVWLNRFEAEHDNLRTALKWSLTPAGDPEKGLRLAAACGLFWKLRTYLTEGRQRLSAALAQPGMGKVTAVRNRALYWSALLAYLQSDYPASRSLCAESLAGAQTLGPAGKSGRAKALSLLGEIATEEGDYATARVRFEEALAIWREVGDVRGCGDTLLQLGWAMMRLGNYEQATTRLEESLALFRKAGSPADIALNLSGLGEAAIRQGHNKRAVQLLEESLTLRQEIGDRWGTGTILGSLGWVALQQGNFKQMKRFLAESIALRLEIQDRGGIAWCLEKLAQAILVQMQAVPEPDRQEGYRQSARIFGAAAGLRTPFGSVIDPADQPEYERSLLTLQTALGQDSFAAAWARGELMPLEAIIEEALTEPDRPGVPGMGLESSEPDDYGGLTPREWETAALIAQGKSNREIAETMTVRLKTVETYITRILNKLGFNSRVQVAVWVIEKEVVPPVADPD